MKKKESLPTKYFKIKFSKLVYLLIIGILLISLACIGVSVAQILRVGFRTSTDYFKYPLLILISILCIVVVVAMLVKSQYGVNKEFLTSAYGFIKSKFAISTITSMLLDTDTKKLTVYFGQEFIVLNIKQEWNEEFIRAILEVKPDIDYSFTMPENKPSDGEE